MRYKICVGISYAIYYLPEEKLGLVLGDLMGLDVIKELALLRKFHDDEDVVGGIEDLVQFDDVGVVDEPEYLDLSLDLLEESGTLEIMFLFLILRLLRILMATLMPVRSCLASCLALEYISPLQSHRFRSSSPGCNGRCAPIPSYLYQRYLLSNRCSQPCPQSQPTRAQDFYQEKQLFHVEGWKDWADIDNTEGA